VWKNNSDDPTCGESYEHKPGDPASPLLRGNGEHNTQMLFLTPEGKLVHVLAGWCGPKELVSQIEFVKKHLKSDEEALAAAHRELARVLALSEDGQGPAESKWWEKHAKKREHDYMAGHALIPLEDYRAEDVVGRGKSFFGAKSGK